MRIAVPFYSQHWDLDAWQAMGYKNREEAQYWERSCCGILCIKMVMDAFLRQHDKPLTPTIKEIIDIGVNQGAYEDISGWSHHGLAALVKSFGFRGEAIPMTTQDLKNYLNNNSLAIVSIKWGFDTANKSLKEMILFWKKYGGHLAVVTGFEEENGGITGFYVHHTSKIKEQNWQDRFIEIEKFKKGYTGRGILIQPYRSTTRI